MEKVLFELSGDQFRKEVLRLKTMTPKMAAQIIKIGGNDSLCIRAVMHVTNEMVKNHLKIDDMESATLVSNTETGEDTIKITWNKKGIKPSVETQPDESKEKRMDDVLRRLAGWIFTLSSGIKQFEKEEADKLIQDINYALYGSVKPPLECQFVTGADANIQAAKVFWRVNEKVILKLLEAARFAKETLEYGSGGAQANLGKNYVTLVDAIKDVEKHFGLKRD
jgi:hypothetical protein